MFHLQHKAQIIDLATSRSASFLKTAQNSQEFKQLISGESLKSSARLLSYCLDCTLSFRQVNYHLISSDTRSSRLALAAAVTLLGSVSDSLCSSCGNTQAV